MGLFQQISSEGSKHGLQFLVIGGLAVNIRRLFEKHGTLELYEKLSRTSARE